MHRSKTNIPNLKFFKTSLSKLLSLKHHGRRKALQKRGITRVGDKNFISRSSRVWDQRISFEPKFSRTSYLIRNIGEGFGFVLAWKKRGFL